MVKVHKNSFINCIALPFKAAPFMSFLQIVSRIISAFMPTLMVLSVAAFVDATISSFNGKGTFQQALFPLVCIGAMMVYHEIKGTIMNFVVSKHKILIAEKIKLDMIKKHAGLEYWHIENNDTWDLINRVCGNSVDSINESFNAAIGMAETIVKMALLVSLMTSYVWWAGILMVLLCTPMVIVSFISGRIHYNADVEADKYVRRADYYNQILMDREYAEERTLFSYTDAINKKWFDLFEKARKTRLRANAKNNIKMYIISFVIGIACFSMTAVLLLTLLSGAVTIGIFIGFSNAAFQNVRNLGWELSYGTKNLAKSMSYMKDLKSFYELSGNEKYLESAKHNVSGHCDIEFHNVSFKYPNTEKFILRNLSLKIENGRHYAFVGTNGAGKTTFTKLLLGFYTGYEGDILINGRNIKEYEQSELKGLIAAVFQGFARYKISVKDNVAVSDLEHNTDEKIISVLEKVGLDISSASISNGLNTVLGKLEGDDDDMSGGQWQKIAICRTLVREDVPLMILDEPTAALDPIAENEIYSLFDNIQKGKTTIFITHRLGSARFADKILVLNDGYIKEAGTHDELINVNGLYADMFTKQRSWYI